MMMYWYRVNAQSINHGGMRHAPCHRPTISTAGMFIILESRSSTRGQQRCGVQDASVITTDEAMYRFYPGMDDAMHPQKS